jgi:NAD(P)H dehydrogenase (quinone)
MSEVSLDEFKKYLEDANVSSLGKFASINMQGYIKEGNNGEELGDPKEFEEVLGRKLEPLPTIIKEYLSSLSD